MNADNIVIGVVIVALLIRRQLRTRPLRDRRALIIIGFLAVLGIAALAFGIASVTKSRSLPDSTIALVVLSLAVAAALGAARAFTVRTWRESADLVLRKGTPATTAFWALSFGAHLLLGWWIDRTTRAGFLGFSTIYLYIAVTLAAQAIMLRRRIAPGPAAA